MRKCRCCFCSRPLIAKGVVRRGKGRSVIRNRQKEVQKSGVKGKEGTKERERSQEVLVTAF